MSIKHKRAPNQLLLIKHNVMNVVYQLMLIKHIYMSMITDELIYEVFQLY